MSRSVCLFLSFIALVSSGCVADSLDVHSDGRDIAGAVSCSPGDIDGCLVGDLHDSSPDPGVQPECALSAFLRGDAEPLEHVVPPCALTDGAPPCYQLALDRDACPRTPSGLHLDLLHDWGDDLIDHHVECVRRRGPRR
jgi:hypothetical protein